MLCLVYIRPKRFSDNSIHSLKIYIQPELNATVKVSTQTIGSPDPILKNSMELDPKRSGQVRKQQDMAGQYRKGQMRTGQIR